MTDNYVSILEESLSKKVEILKQIKELSQKQAQLLTAEELNLEDFDSIVDKKSEQIDQINALDEGFENLYQRVSESLAKDRLQYAEPIRRMQDLIREITEINTSIQVQESRNKAALEQHFKKQREVIGSGRRSSKAAYDYYRSASSANVVLPQFVDKKK